MPFHLSPDQIKQIKNLFQQADSLIISAGAGMGVDSGLPDFRGNQGMWQAYPELGKQRIDFTEIANPAAFKRHPRLAWGFYGHRLALYRQTTPHSGFLQLKQLAEILELPNFVFTSNVDGQFQKAGFNPDHIYECHGSIHHLQCLDACTQTIWPADELKPEIDHQDCQWLGQLPQCPYCDGLARPNILMFNDMGWFSHQHDQQAKHLKAFLKDHQRPVVIEMGAGTAIPTVRYFSEQFAPGLIRINLREYTLPASGGIALATTAEQGVRSIYQIFIE
ncbi:SIR2 family NAD-dependent protein deacylase [Acinetobacter higginsii]|uniref:SIR2 family NAD-dependent protein deacylase n=1 Tax=Acinetobacter higginsii TaxID=70347 RepID=UPI00267644F5|nr:Sir2 family NAD-dependent protein deacetylase [Acinetobacter higginsii]MDO3666418.1 Sir2 family NAD-dependent protein deacetylase [Acinetobacter higginsii]